MTDHGPRLHVARAELTLARSDRHPLRDVPLRPDPLRDLVVAIASADPNRRERAEVCLDLQPATAHERQRWMRAATATHEPSWRTGLGADVRTGLTGKPTNARGAQPRPTVLERAETKASDRKALGARPAFWVQLLCRCQSEEDGRAEALLQQLLAGLDVFTGENHWRAVGTKLGPWFVGSADAWWRRREFDHRWRTGMFRPRRRRVVTVAEVAGLLKPPTATCPAELVARSVGVIPPPPRNLLEWREGERDLLPLGVVRTKAGSQPVAVRLSETLFSYNSGRASFGKTESALGRFVAIARAGHGAMYLDPHGDAIDLVKHYLGDVAERIEEINLGADPNQLQAGWNPISMAGLGRYDIESKVSAVVDSFAAALNWGEINNRALTLTTMAVQSLCELALQLPDELAPTIFQITTLLADEDWRDSVVPFLSPPAQAFWTTRFPKLSADAITPVTNLIDRLRSSPTVAALLGSSQSTYDVRRSMDDGRIVLWSTAGTGAWATLVNCFVTYDLFRAAMSRRSTPRADRRPFWAFIDELQRVSGTGSGSAGESVARALEEARKYGLRLVLMSQQPTRLARPTLEAIFTNRSHLLSHTVGAESAKLLAREWGGRIDADTLTLLPKYQFITQVTLDGQISSPFLVRGFELNELWGHCHNDDATPIDRAVDATLRRRPVGELLDELDQLDERIVGHLATLTRPGLPDGLLEELTASFHPPARASGATTDLGPISVDFDELADEPFDDGVVTPIRPRRTT